MYLVRVYDGSLRWLAPVERGIYRLCRRRSRRRSALDALCRRPCCSSARAAMLLTYLVLRLQHLLPLNPQHLAAVPDRQAFETAASFTTNTNWQSYSRRDDDVVLLADDAAHVPQLRLGGGGHGGRGGAGARHHAAERPAGSATSGSTLVRGTLYVLLPFSLLLALLFVQQGVIQNFAHYVDDHHARRREADASRWGRSPARKRSSSSAPTAAASSTPTPRIRSRIPTPWSNFWQMVAIFVIPAGADIPVRPDGEEPEARLGDLGRDVRPVRGRHDHGVLGRSARQSDSRGARASMSRRRRRIPAATWKGRRCASASPTPRCSPRSPPMRRAARSTPCTTRSRRSAGWCRWSISSSARWSSAASARGSTACSSMVVLAVFIAGLMVGRTPEYLGKKIQAREVQMVMLYRPGLRRRAILVLHRGVCVDASRGWPGSTTRPARLVGDPLRLQLHRREQRQRVRRADRHDLLLQHACSASTR